MYAPGNHFTIYHQVPPIGWVYLLHFEQKYYHAGHYCGSTCNLDARLALHNHGNGARLTEVVSHAGIGMELVRLWQFDSYAEARAFESRLKRAGHSPRNCPVCQHKPVDVYTALRQGHLPLALHDRHGAWKPRRDGRPLYF